MHGAMASLKVSLKLKSYGMDISPRRYRRVWIDSDPKPNLMRNLTFSISPTPSPRALSTRYEWSITTFGSRLLLVDLGASDAILRKQFSSWLIDQRKKANTVRRRGPKAANFEITSEQLRTWADQKLLPVWDLDFYAKVFGLSKLTPKTLCDAVDVNERIDPKEGARATRSKAGDLLKNIEYLPR